MDKLENNIKLVEALPITTDDSAIESDAIDTHGAGDEKFDTALVMVSAAAFGADVDEVLVKVEEDDDDEFGTASVAEGGAEVEITDGGFLTFQVKRTKRYLRVVVTPTASDTDDNVTVQASAILSNWALPLPIV